MITSGLHKAVRKQRMTIIVLSILLLSTLVSVFISTKNYKTGLIVIIGILFFAILAFSVNNYVFGFYASMTLGFLVFTVNRIFASADLPIAMLVEVPAYVTLLGLLIHKWNVRNTLFDYFKNSIAYCLVGYLLFLLLQVVNPDMLSIDGWVVATRRFLVILILFFIALHVFNSVRDIVFFFSYWISLAFISGLYACYQHWFGLFDFEMNLIQFDKDKLGLLFIDGVLRKSSLFSDPATFGIVLASTFTSILVLLLSKVRKHKRGLLIFLNFVILLGVAYSGTRTAYFIIIAGISLYVLMNITQGRTILFSVFVFFGFLCLMYLPINSNNTINRIRSTFEFSDDASLNVRDVNRASIQPYIYEHPFGGGLNTSGGLGKKYNAGHILAGFPSDSGYVKAAIETGWVGLFLLCIIYFVTLHYGVVTYFRCKNKMLKSYLIASVVCVFTFVIAQYGQEATDQIPGFFLFYSCFAVFIKARHIDENLNQSLT